MEAKTPFVFEEGSSGHKAWKGLWWGLFTLAVILYPFIRPSFEIGRMNRAIILGLAILGLNLVVGYAGMIALGHSAFLGIGAFIGASLVQDEGWDYWMVIPVALIAGFIVGLIVGLPALRIKGLYLALCTIAFASVFPTLLKLDQWGISKRTGGPNGRVVKEEVRAPTWLEFIPKFGDARGGAVYRYFLIVIICAVCWWLVSNLINSRPGRAVIAIRDNETGAAVSGVNTRIYKSITFAISAALGCLGGMLLTMDKGFAGEQDFTFLLAIDLIVGLVIGGVGTLWGGLLGGLVVVFVRDWAKRISIPLGFYTLDGSGPLSQATFGLILILVTFFAPGGLVSAGRWIRSKVVTVIPKPPKGATDVDLTNLANSTGDRTPEAVT